MRLQKEQAHAITAAVWLFGMAALFYTNRWWPGLKQATRKRVAGRAWWMRAAAFIWVDKFLSIS